MNPQIAQLFIIFLYLLLAAVVIRALLSWLPISPRNEFARFVFRVTEPLLEPVRRILPRTGVIDFSGAVVIILLLVMIAVVRRVSA